MNRVMAAGRRIGPGLVATAFGAAVALSAIPAHAAAGAPAGSPVRADAQVVRAGQGTSGLPGGGALAAGFVRATAACPVGKVVFGGGSQVVGSGSADFKTSIQESAPGSAGSQSVWLTALRNNDSVAHTVGLFAVCGNTPAGYQVVRSDFAVAAGGFLRATAACPVGKVVIGGGSQVVGSGSADFRTRVQESAPGSAGSQSVWLTALRNNGPVARTVGLFAVCANPPAAYQVVRQDVVS